MKGIKKQYLIAPVLLCIIEILWVFVMYKTLAEPSNKKIILTKEQLKEGICYDIAWEDTTLVVVGADPYLILDCPKGIIKNITMHWQNIEGINQIACYYDTGNGYTESHKVTTDITYADNISLNIERFVKTVRIDFEYIEGNAVVQPDTIFVEYVDKNVGMFLFYQIVLMLLFDWLLTKDLLKQHCSWLGSAMKAIAFAFLQFFIFKAYTIASGTVLMILFLSELFITVCIISTNFGGIDCAKE